MVFKPDLADGHVALWSGLAAQGMCASAGERVPALVDLLSLQRDQSVLDVACGTGAVTRHVMSKVGSEGHVVGLDVNPNMLEMARRTAPEIEWHEGNAAELPFREDEFDAVVCQQSLQFFPDKPQALREMLRVLRPGGHLALAMWLSIESSPGYYASLPAVNRQSVVKTSPER